MYLFFGTSSDIDDRDIVDNKGASNPITNIEVNNNPKPQNILEYKHITLNEKENGLYESIFLVAINVPLDGWINSDELKVNEQLTCIPSPPEDGDTPRSINGKQQSDAVGFKVSLFRMTCVSKYKIEDNGELIHL